MLTAKDLEKLLPEFISHLTASTSSRSTIKNYSSDLRRIIGKLDQYKEIDSLEISSALEELKKEFSESTIRRFGFSLKAFTNWLSQNGYAIKQANAVSPQKVSKAVNQTPVEGYLSELEKQGTPESTIRHYRKDLGNFFAWLRPGIENLSKIDRATVNKISTFDIKRYISFQKSRQVSDATINRQLYSLKSFFGIHKEKVVYDSNPVNSFISGQTKRGFWSRLKLKKPRWWHAYRGHPLSDYVNWAAMAVLTLIIGLNVFGHFFVPATEKIDVNQLKGLVLASTPPAILSFQGRLTNNVGAPVTSSSTVVFKIYDAETAGTLKWTSKDWEVVPDANGIFSACLGNTTTTDDCLIDGVADTAFPAGLFADNAALYLEVIVEGETLTPRQRIASSSYALNSDSLDGIDSLSFLRSDTSDNFTSGTLTTDASTTLDVNGTLAWGGATISEALNNNNQLITNIGDAGTDFVSGGGLTLAGTLTSNGVTALNNDTTITMNSGTASDDLILDVTYSGSGNKVPFRLNYTNNGTASSDILAVYTNVSGGSGTTERLLQLQNLDDSTVTDGILISSNNATGGTITNGITFFKGGSGSFTQELLLQNGESLSNSVDGVINFGSTTNLTANGALSVSSNTGNAITLDSGTTGNVNLGTGNNAKTIAIGTGNAGNTINIGTNNTVSDTISIGSALDNIAITGDDWSVTAAGVLTVASCSGCGGGSQTPWASDIDADNFDLLDFGDSLTARAAVTISSTGASNDIILNSADTIELQDNTNITGNLDISGSGAVGSSSSIITGEIFRVAGDIVGATCFADICAGVVSFTTITTSSINAGGDSAAFWGRADVANTAITVPTASAFYGAAHVKGVAATLTDAVGLYLEPQTAGTNNYGICFDCDGTWSASTVASGIQFGNDANGVNLYRSGSNVLQTDDTFSVNGNAIFTSAGTIQYTAGTTDSSTVVCRNSSGILAGCSGTSGTLTLQGAYDGGNTITTTSASDIALTLAAGLGTATKFSLTNNHISNTTDFYLNNANASGTNTNGILIEQTGAGTLTNAINILQTSGIINNGIVIDANSAAPGFTGILQTITTTGVSGTQRALSVVFDGTGVSEQGLYINQSAAGTITDGIKIENNGGTYNTGINLTNTSGTFNTGIAFTGTFGTGINLYSANLTTGIYVGTNSASSNTITTGYRFQNVSAINFNSTTTDSFLADISCVSCASGTMAVTNGFRVLGDGSGTTITNGLNITTTNSAVVTNGINLSSCTCTNGLNLGTNKILASGSFTIDLNNGANDILTITNTAAGVASISLAENLSSYSLGATGNLGKLEHIDLGGFGIHTQVTSDTNVFFMIDNDNNGAHGGHQFAWARDGSTITDSIATLTDWGLFTIPINDVLIIDTSLQDTTNLDNVQDVFVQGKYAYVVAGGTTDRLTVVDVNDTTTNIFDANGMAVEGTVASVLFDNPNEIFVVGHYAYVVTSSDRLIVVDVSNPNTPSLAGILTDATNLDGATDIYVRGRYAYITAATADRLTVVDISDPTTPFVFASITNSTTLNDAQALDIQGNYAYVCVSDNVANGRVFSVVDITDPSNMVISSTAIEASSNNADCDDILVSGKYVYTANYSFSNMVIFDVSNPASPSKVNTADVGTFAKKLALAGSYLYVAREINDQIDVIDVSNPSSPVLYAGTTDATNLDGVLSIFVDGLKVFAVAPNVDRLTVYKNAGFSSPGALLGNAQIGNLNVLQESYLGNQLTVGNSINVGLGGVQSVGTGTFAGIAIPTGVTNDIYFRDATPNIKLGGTDNAGSLTIIDNCSSGCANGGTSNNTLFEFKDINTNFGGIALAGAWISKNSYWGEEFNSWRAGNCTADTVQARGDAGTKANACTAQTGDISTAVTLSGTGTCTFASSADSLGGFERITTADGNGTGACLEYIGSSTANDAQLIFNSNNLPVYEMKVRPSRAATGDDDARYFVGMGNIGTNATGASTDAQTIMDSTTDTGIYFSNCTAPQTAANCNDSTWNVSVQVAGSAPVTVDCGVTISTTQFAYMRVEVVSAGGSAISARAYVDGNVSDGIAETQCPAWGSPPTINGVQWGFFAQTFADTTLNGSFTFDIDFIRIWQDDAPSYATNEEPLNQLANPDNQVDGEEKLTLQSNSIATEAAQLLGGELSEQDLANIFGTAGSIWYNSAGQVVSWVNQSGEAFFTKVTSLVGNFRKLIFGELVVKEGSQVAGEGTFEEGATEVLIPSDKISDSSLINITPTTKTNGLSLYVKEKRPGEGFVVALEENTTQTQEASTSAKRKIQFTWFILNQEE